MSGWTPHASYRTRSVTLDRVSRTILFLDMIESVRLIEANEDALVRHWIHFLDRLNSEVIPQHDGRVVKKTGDGLLVEFENPHAAATAAIAIQKFNAEHNKSSDASGQFHLRIGIDAGDVVMNADDLFGERVNTAARLMGVAEAGEIVVSAGVRDALASELDAEFEDLGECYLRNMSNPVHAYRARPPGYHPRLPPLIQDVQLSPTVAVVPFAEGGPATKLYTLGEVLAEEIIVALARSPDLNIISRLSTRAFRTRRASLQKIGEALHADFVLSGIYTGHDQRVAVHAELAEVKSGSVLWAQELTDKASQILEADQGMIAQIAADVRTTILRREAERARMRPLPSLESYTLLVSAIELMHRLSPSNFAMAQELLQTLIERAPRHPVPQSWMARWHVLRVQQGWSDNLARDAQLAKECTHRALDADPANSLALVIDGFVHTNLLKQLDAGEERYQTALENAPNDALGRLLLGTLYAFRGEGNEAVRETEHARFLTPLDPHRFFFDSLAASACLAAEKYERALQLAQRSLRANRTHTSTLRVKAVAQMRLGRKAQARQTAAELMALEPNLTVRRWLERSPSADYPVGQAFARTLREAGVPD